MLAIVVSAEGGEEVGVSLKVRDLEDVVPADVSGALRHILHRVHLDGKEDY